MPLTIVGTVAFDSIETPHGKHDKVLGGTASYACVAASLYTDVHMIGIVGQDFPDAHIDFFNSRKINTEGLLKVEGKTMHWVGSYEGDMNMAITKRTDLNVLTQFNPHLHEKARSSKIVFLANTDPLIQKKVILQLKSPHVIMMDTMNYWIQDHRDNLMETLKLIDVLIINDAELRMLTGIDNIVKAMPKVLEWGPKRLIVKKGEHGAIMYNGKTFFICPAFPLNELVDPTGAGDSFAGGICGYLAKADNLDEETYIKAMLAGTLISSYTVQGFSLERLKTLTQEKLHEKYDQLKSYLRFPGSLD